MYLTYYYFELQDSTPLNNLSNSDRALTMNKAQVLRIEDSKISDTGRYTCMAMSIAGKATKNFKVKVYGG